MNSSEGVISEVHTCK